MLTLSPEGRGQGEGPRLVGGHEAEKGGVLALAGQALQVVERHVRVRRRAQLGEQPRQRGRQQLGLARRRGHRMQVAQRRGRIGEAHTPELTERTPVVGGGGE